MVFEVWALISVSNMTQIFILETTYDQQSLLNYQNGPGQVDTNKVKDVVSKVASLLLCCGLLNVPSYLISLFG